MYTHKATKLMANINNVITNKIPKIPDSDNVEFLELSFAVILDDGVIDGDFE